MLEYYEVPGITFNLRLFKAQQIATTGKKLKTEHAGCSPHEMDSCMWCPIS